MKNRSASPLRLRRVGKADAGRLNSVFKPRRKLDLGGDMALHDHQVGKVALGTQPVRIDFTIGEMPLILCCQQTLLTALLASVALPSQDPGVADIYALVVELALDPLLTRLEATTGMKVSIKSVALASAQPTGTIRLLELEAFGDKWPLVLSGPLTSLEHLFGHWPQAQKKRLDLGIVAFMRIGSTDLTADLIHSLGAGDAILFERRAGGPSSGKLVIGDHLLADAVWNSGWRLVNAPAVLHRGREIWLGNPGAAKAATGDDYTVKETDIPMTLCFDVGNALLPVQELRRLRAGSTVDLPTMADTPIRITVDGNCIGKGELIQIEGRNAVRVMTMFHHEMSAP